MNKNLITVLAVLVISVLGAALIINGGGEHEAESADEHGTDEHGHGDEADQEATGPNGGRLLSEHDFAVEVMIAETGTPPEFRLIGYEHDEPLSPDAFDADLVVTRLGGETEQFTFVPAGDYQRAAAVVAEPHSFDVEVIARYEGEKYSWHYETHESRVTIPDGIARDSGIGTAIAGPAVILETLELTGTVQAVPSNLAEVRPRFPGIIRSIKRDIGDTVRAGETLATVESNESLRSFNVIAPIGGTIIARDTQVGQVVGDEPLFRVIDLSTVWVQLDVFGRSKDRIRAGQSVTVTTLAGYETTGTIEWLSPLVAHGSQSIRARVPLANADGHVRPGQFVRGVVTVGETEVSLAVETRALQSLRDSDVAFEKVGEIYEARFLETGRRDSSFTEVLDGISVEAEYVTENSYLIKADIEKSGASHQH